MDAKDEIPTAKRFRERLKQLREERSRWTQSDLAEQAQVSVVTISKLEQGKNLPTFEVLMALCTALKVSPNEMVGWSTDSNELSAELLLAERISRALRRMPKTHANAIVELAEKLAKG